MCVASFSPVVSVLLSRGVTIRGRGKAGNRISEKGKATRDAGCLCVASLRTRPRERDKLDEEARPEWATIKEPVTFQILIRLAGIKSTNVPPLSLPRLSDLSQSELRTRSLYRVSAC